MYDLGENTQDIHALGTLHPVEQHHGLPASERENRIRRTGTRCLWASTALLTADALAILTLMAFAHRTGSAWSDPVTRQLIGLVILLGGFTATALLTAGIIERQQRQTRTLIRRAMARADANADVGDSNRASIDALTNSINSLISMVEGAVRDVSKVQQAVVKVAGYGQGVAEGWKLGRQSAGLDDLDDLPGVKPDNMGRFGPSR